MKSPNINVGGIIFNIIKRVGCALITRTVIELLLALEAKVNSIGLMVNDQPDSITITVGHITLSCSRASNNNR